MDEFERCFTPHDLPLTALEFAKIVRRVMDEAPELTRAVLALPAALAAHAGARALPRVHVLTDCAPPTGRRVAC